MGEHSALHAAKPMLGCPQHARESGLLHRRTAAVTRCKTGSLLLPVGCAGKCCARITWVRVTPNPKQGSNSRSSSWLLARLSSGRRLVAIQCAMRAATLSSGSCLTCHSLGGCEGWV